MLYSYIILDIPTVVSKLTHQPIVASKPPTSLVGRVPDQIPIVIAQSPSYLAQQPSIVSSTSSAGTTSAPTSHIILPKGKELLRIIPATLSSSTGNVRTLDTVKSNIIPSTVKCVSQVSHELGSYHGQIPLPVIETDQLSSKINQDQDSPLAIHIASTQKPGSDTSQKVETILNLPKSLTKSGPTKVIAASQPIHSHSRIPETSSSQSPRGEASKEQSSVDTDQETFSAEALTVTVESPFNQPTNMASSCKELSSDSKTYFSTNKDEESPRQDSVLETPSVFDDILQDSDELLDTLKSSELPDKKESELVGSDSTSSSQLEVDSVQSERVDDNTVVVDNLPSTATNQKQNVTEETNIITDMESTEDVTPSAIPQLSASPPQPNEENQSDPVMKEQAEAEKRPTEKMEYPDDRTADTGTDESQQAECSTGHTSQTTEPVSPEPTETVLIKEPEERHPHTTNGMTVDSEPGASEMPHPEDSQNEIEPSVSLDADKPVRDFKDSNVSFFVFYCWWTYYYL